MSYRLNISAPKASETADKLEALGKRTVQARGAFESIGNVLLNEQKARWGKGWKKDAPSTIAAKKRKNEPTTVGVASGALMKSLTEKGAKGQIWEVKDDQLRLGTNLPHAHLFDKGRKGNQPARKAIRITKQGRQQVVDLIADHIMGRET